VVGGATGKNTVPDVPPPGPGLTTVIEAVPALAVSVARMVAVSCPSLTN